MCTNYVFVVTDQNPLTFLNVKVCDTMTFIFCFLFLGLSGEMEEEMENPEMVDLPEKQKHQLRHRELFLSRQLESLPATHIR